MSLYFADDANQLSFGVQASNVSEVAQFSSTIDDVVIRMFTNNSLATDNLVTGVAIGSSNYDKSATASNNLYIGHINGTSNITPVFLMQDNKIAINTVPYSNYSVTAHNGLYADEVATPMLTAFNVNDTFYNIAANTYVNCAFVSIGSISPIGDVPFNVTFKGNSTRYDYHIICTSNTASIVSPLQSSTTASMQYVARFSSGTYNVNIDVSTPGSGIGSFYATSNAAAFTVGATDSIGSPSVTLASAPTFSSNLTYVGGIPYFASGTTMAFPRGALHFTNMFSVIDPRGYSSINNNALTLNGTQLAYASLYTDVTHSSSSNDYIVSTTLTGGGASIVSIPAIVRNVNNQSGVSSTLMTGIAYLGTPVNERTMTMAQYTGLPITEVSRLSIPSSESTPRTPVIANLTSYAGTSSAYDSFYCPFDSLYYTTASAVPRGTYKPALSDTVGGTRQYLTFCLTCTAPLPSFVLSLTNSTSISEVQVAWQSVNNGTWYDAKYMYNASGCGAATYPSDAAGVRFPVRLPQGVSLSATTNVYINIKFTGNIALSGINVSYA
jgi:hypothetical protein